MEYEVELFGNTYHLPTYSISIAEKLDQSVKICIISAPSF